MFYASVLSVPFLFGSEFESYLNNTFVLGRKFSRQINLV